MKVALYARVSSEKQDIALSISAQLRALREYAEKNYRVVREFVDEAETGRTSARPAFKQMISLARSPQKPFEQILVWECSRFARSRVDSILYKAMFERILHWYGEAYRLSSISLRYFNVAGASKQFGVDHNPETSLIPNIIKVALRQQDYIPIFGTDYDTHDGTCIRDYIHVLDIAQAHILALNGFEENMGSKVYNIGNGEGYS